MYPLFYVKRVYIVCRSDEYTLFSNVHVKGNNTPTQLCVLPVRNPVVSLIALASSTLNRSYKWPPYILTLVQKIKSGHTKIIIL